LVRKKEKSEEKQNESIINQLSKTIVDNSKVLGDFGMARPFVSEI